MDSKCTGRLIHDEFTFCPIHDVHGRSEALLPPLDCTDGLARAFYAGLKSQGISVPRPATFIEELDGLLRSVAAQRRPEARPARCADVRGVHRCELRTGHVGRHEDGSVYWPLGAVDSLAAEARSERDWRTLYRERAKTCQKIDVDVTDSASPRTEVETPSNVPSTAPGALPNTSGEETRTPTTTRPRNTGSGSAKAADNAGQTISDHERSWAIAQAAAVRFGRPVSAFFASEVEEALGIVRRETIAACAKALVFSRTHADGTYFTPEEKVLALLRTSHEPAARCECKPELGQPEHPHEYTEYRDGPTLVMEHCPSLLARKEGA